MKAISDKILVQRIVADRKTAGGLIIPETVGRDRVQKGIVVSVGRGRVLNGKVIKPSVIVDDIILYSKYLGDEFVLNKEPHLFLREDDILGVVE